MDFFNYKNGELYCEDVPAERIAREVGTPAYVYSKATLLHHYRQVADAFAPVHATVTISEAARFLIEANGEKQPMSMDLDIGLQL